MDYQSENTTENSSNTINLDRYESYVINCQLYYIPILVIFGVLGNILSVCVFFYTKLRKLSSSYYLSSLAVSDTVFLITVFIAWLELVKIYWFITQWVCKITMYLTYVSSFLSVWLIIVFTIERFVAVRYPLLRQSLCTTSRAKFIITLLVIISLLSYAPVLKITKVGEDSLTNKTVCHVDEDWFNVYRIFNMIDAVLTIVIPVFTISLLNALIGRSIWKLSNIRKKLTERETNVTSTQRKNNSSGKKNKVKSGSFNQNKVTRMLLIISTVFLFISLPSYIMRLLIYFPVSIKNGVVVIVV